MLNAISKYLTIRNGIFFFSLIAGWPCVFYLMGWLPNYKINYIVLLIAAFAFAIATTKRQLPRDIQLLFGLQILTWGCYAFAYVDTTYYTRILILLITYCLLLMQQSDKDRHGFIKVYDGWLTLQTCLGAVGMILVLMGVLEPLFEFKEMDGRPGYCFGLFTTNTYDPAFNLIRNAGFYDEPGALAFWGIIALLYNKIFVHHSKLEFILIICLLSTLSLAYYLQLAIYIIYFYRHKGPKMIISVLLILGIMIYLSSYSEGMQKLITERVQIDETTGRLSGDNRTELFEVCWNLFLRHPVFGWGASYLTTPELFHEVGFVGANFFYNFAADGLVGVIITYLPLICILGKGKGNNDYYIISIILLLGYLQRPYDNTQLLYPLTAYSLLYCIITVRNRTH